MATELKICPSTLSKNTNGYSRSGLNKLFEGRLVSPILPFKQPKYSEKVRAKLRENRVNMSISGYQIKYSLKLRKNKLSLTEKRERGEYILKPIPIDETLENKEFLPANEHLTMQLAEQVFQLKTAANGLIFFPDGTHAYITRRFDYKTENERYGMEDFCSLLDRTEQNFGEHYKNEGSYELLKQVLERFTSASIIEKENLFKLILFNYLISNGDAHLKNFSLLETDSGDYLLAPAYDLINTRLHLPNDTPLALSNGFFEDEYVTESFDTNGYYSYNDFEELAKRFGIMEKRFTAIMDFFSSRTQKSMELIDRSFLSNKLKKQYKDYYQDRLRAIEYKFIKTY